MHWKSEHLFVQNACHTQESCQPLSKTLSWWSFVVALVVLVELVVRLGGHHS